MPRLFLFFDTAIAAEQEAGADTSALEELKGRMESAKSEAARVQTDTRAQAAKAAAERNMIKAVSALTNLSSSVQNKADAWEARQALYDYMKADEGGKAAAQSKAAEQLRESISAALEAKGLDTRTRQRLEGILDNIDSKGEMGDNIKKGDETVTYRRVQGGTPPNASRERIIVLDDGRIKITNKGLNLNVSAGNEEHANYFLSKRGEGAYIVAFDIPLWLDNFIKENAIPQFGYNQNYLNQSGTAPKIVDPTTPGITYELPPPWAGWIEEYGRNGRIIKP